MGFRLSQYGLLGSSGGMMPGRPEFNVLANQANWAWPQALRAIFQPRGVNLLMAREATEFVHIIEQKRIHTAIIDIDSPDFDALATVKVLRIHFPMLPTILLASRVSEDMLGRALKLEVFSVVDKPVDMRILRELLDRLFMKRYNSPIFAE